MAEWSWATGEVSGRCPTCQHLLRCSDILVAWRGNTYHVGCLIDTLAAFAPKTSMYHLPGNDWQAP